MLKMPAVTTGPPSRPHGTAVVTGAVAPAAVGAAAHAVSPSASPRGYIPLESLPSSTRSSVNLLFDRVPGGPSAVRGAIDQLPQSYSSTHDVSQTVTTGAVSNPSSPSQPRSVGGPVSPVRHHATAIPRLPLHTITTGILSSSTRVQHYPPNPASCLASSSLSVTTTSGAIPVAQPTPRRLVRAPASLDSARASIAGATVTSGAVEARPWAGRAPRSMHAGRNDQHPSLPQLARPRQAAQPPVHLVTPPTLDTTLSAVLSPRFSRGSGSPQLSPRELQRSLSADHADSIAEVLADMPMSGRRADLPTAKQPTVATRSTGSSPSPSAAAAAVTHGSSGSGSGSGDAAAWQRVSNASGSLAPASSGPLLSPQHDTPTRPAPAELLSASRPSAPVTTGAPEAGSGTPTPPSDLVSASSRDQSSNSGGTSVLTGRTSQAQFSTSGGSLFFVDSAPWDLPTSSSAVVSTGGGASQGSLSTQALSTQLTGLSGIHLPPSGSPIREQFGVTQRVPSLSSCGDVQRPQPDAAADGSRGPGGGSGSGSVHSGQAPATPDGASAAAAPTSGEHIRAAVSGESAHSPGGSPGSSYGSGTMPCSGSDGASAACNSISIAQLPSAAAAESSAESPGGRRPLKQNSLDLGSHPGRLRVGEETARASLQRWEDQRSLKARQALLAGVPVPPGEVASGLTVVTVLPNGAKANQVREEAVEHERVIGDGSALSLRGDDSELGLAAVMTLSPRVPEQSGGNEYDLSLTGPSDIMSSAMSSVNWRENETAGTHWRENPLSDEHDAQSCGESPQLGGVDVAQQGAEWMSNPLAAGAGVGQAQHAVESG